MTFSATQLCNIATTFFRIVPTLQRCVALKIVVANRTVQHHLKSLPSLECLLVFFSVFFFCEWEEMSAVANKANLDRLGSLTSNLLTAEPVLNSDYVHTLYQTSLARARKPYRIGLLFTHKNGDCGAVSIIERSRAAPRRCHKRRVTNRMGVHSNRDIFSCRHEKLSGIDLFTDRYGSHIESVRFKEYYGMPKVHEHDPTYSLSIYAGFSANFSLSFPIKKIFKGKIDRCAVFGCNNDCLFRRKYTVKFSFGPKSGRKY